MKIDFSGDEKSSGNTEKARSDPAADEPKINARPKVQAVRKAAPARPQSGRAIAPAPARPAVRVAARPRTAEQKSQAGPSVKPARAADRGRSRRAANDDVRSVGNLLYALQRRPSFAPFWSAFILSAAWILIGGILALAVWNGSAAPFGRGRGCQSRCRHHFVGNSAAGCVVLGRGPVHLAIPGIAAGIPDHDGSGHASGRA